MGMGRMNPGKKGVRTILESDLWRIAESRSTAAIRSVRGGGGPLPMERDRKTGEKSMYRPFYPAGNGKCRWRFR